MTTLRECESCGRVLSDTRVDRFTVVTATLMETGHGTERVSREVQMCRNRDECEVFALERDRAKSGGGR